MDANTTNQLMWYQDPVVVSTIVIAIATVVNVVVSYFLWRATYHSMKITQKVFEAANRPYLGTQAVKTIRDDLLRFSVEIKNVGTAAADKVKVNWKFSSSNLPVPINSSSGEPTVIMPQ